MIAARSRDCAAFGTAALLGLAMSGCGSDESNEPIEPLGPEPFELEIRIENVQPAVEDTQCRKVRLGNVDPVAISRIVNDISASHHFVVSSINEDEAGEEQLEPFPCEPFRAPLLGSPLAITQKHHDAYDLPPGVGYALTPNQMMHLELHFINSGTEPVDVSARTSLYPLKEGDLRNEASVLVVGHLGVSIPPNSDHTLGPIFQELIDQEVPDKYADVSIYAMTGHTHRFGTDVRIGTVDSPEATPTPRYALDRFVWDAPEVVTFTPAFQIAPGGGFSYSCSWSNPTGETIGFGESANAEMCFFWAYYYPRKPGRPLFLQR